jgi:hypothetical protein
MDTFKDLYHNLQTIEDTDILSWLVTPWKGKDKQESLLRLFAGLGLIVKLKSFHICKGNFNKKTITKHTTLKDVFYDSEDNPIKLKDKGDSSDLTGICRENPKHLLVTTSKNLTKTQVGKLDIDKILTNFKQYEDDEYTMSLCVCVRDSSSDIEEMKTRIERSNHRLKRLLEKEDTIVIDWEDLNEAYHKFKSSYGQTPISDIINSNKETLCLKMHQELGVLKTLRLKNGGKEKILWGHIQRSGKSYIIAGCVIEYCKTNVACNFLVITTAPKETFAQLFGVFDCIQLNNFNVVLLTGNNKKPQLTTKNIIICSKQFLQTKIDQNHEKTKSIGWLKKMVFDMRFIDESHNGGTTSLAKKTLDYYGKDSFTVHITATYSKPINDYSISKDCRVLWDLEDVILAKSIDKPGSEDRLVEKHGDCIKDIINRYSRSSIIREYSRYPELCILTDELKPDVVTKVLNATQDNNYGWSLEGCFLLKQAIVKDTSTNKSSIIFKEEFQNEIKVLELCYRIFGKQDEFGIAEYPNSCMNRYKDVCKNPTIDTRCIGEGYFHTEPMIIIAFLPQNNVNLISNALKKVLEKHNVIPDFEITIINSKTTNNPKQCIEDARIKARHSGKKGVLVLSGRQCSLGVSIDNCDIVLLLNNNMSYNMIQQMMFRCMTEGKNKKCGFVFDLNIHRAIETFVNYASLIKPDIHPREATKYILQERLINLNGDHWLPSFGNAVTNIDRMCENVYDIYSSNTVNALNNFLNRLSFKHVILTNGEKQLFHAMFSNIPPTNTQREQIERLLDQSHENTTIKKGIEKIKICNEIVTPDPESSDENHINYMDVLKHVIPLICILTIHDKETSFVEMFRLIETNEYVYNILIEQTRSWWGKSVDSELINMFINIYIKYMKDDKETNQIIRTVKDLFMKNIHNSNELSKLIDKYLIPQELEKKRNAEVSTPFALRQEMLDKIPLEFWTSVKKVFEPCAGKGGFVVDIIDRFMKGLETTIPDAKLRYKTIVEECLYFSDINPVNIYICKLLIDPYNEYSLNYHEGNTLQIDISDKWGIDGFDAVIGNPPYNEDPEKSKDPHMKPVYQDWIYKFNEISEMLMFITPSKWFSSSDKLLVKLRDYMKTCNIEFIQHYPQDNVFNNVKIKGGVSYYLLNKQFEGSTLFNNCLIDINKYDILVEPKYYDLLTKIQKYNSNTLTELYCSQGTFLSSKTEKELTSTGDILCYVSKNKGLKKYISTDKIKKKFDYWKVITPAAAYKGTSGFSDLYILNPTEIHSRSYISFKVKSESEARSLYSYLKCKLVQVLLSLRKQTHNLCNSQNFIWIPLVPLNQEWTNDMLYEYFDLDSTDINLIRDIKLDGSYIA